MSLLQTVAPGTKVAGDSKTGIARAQLTPNTAANALLNQTERRITHPPVASPQALTAPALFASSLGFAQSIIAANRRRGVPSLAKQLNHGARSPWQPL
jgi:hypothetical protein